MFRKTVTDEQAMQDQQLDLRRKIEATLSRLQALRNNILELRCRCEELAKQRLDDKGKVLICGECGIIIEPSQEIAFRDSGTEEHYYHRTCFRKLLLSLDL